MDNYTELDIPEFVRTQAKDLKRLTLRKCTPVSTKFGLYIRRKRMECGESISRIQVPADERKRKMAKRKLSRYESMAIHPQEENFNIIVEWLGLDREEAQAELEASKEFLREHGVAGIEMVREESRREIEEAKLLYPPIGKHFRSGNTPISSQGVRRRFRDPTAVGCRIDLPYEIYCNLLKQSLSEGKSLTEVVTLSYLKAINYEFNDTPKQSS